MRSIPFELIGANAFGGRVGVVTDVALTTDASVALPGGFEGAQGPGSVSYSATYDSQGGFDHGLDASLSREAPVAGIKILGLGVHLVVGVGS